MIVIKNKTQIQNIQVAGNIISQIFVHLQDYIEEGMTTQSIDSHIHELIIKEGGTPSFLGYEGYPAASCISINEEIIHGIPNKDTRIKEGDIISVDIGVTYQKGIADSAYTYYLGQNIPADIKKLIDTTKDALMSGIRAVKPKNHIVDISQAVQAVAKQANVGIVRDYCGHGVGVSLHEKPEIPNYTPNLSPNPRLREGMIIAIEPMFTQGSHQTRLKEDQFTVATKDQSNAAHFEHTVLITAEGYKILT